MKTFMVLFAMALPLAFTTPALAQAKSPNGAWRCSAQGNIPIGLMTINGGSYTFRAVSLTNWQPKPSDSLNGNGQISIAGAKMTMVSGSLHARGVRSGIYGPSGKSDYMDFFTDPKGYYYLRCLRP